jgi:hypothetical protein
MDIMVERIVNEETEPADNREAEFEPEEWDGSDESGDDDDE